MTTQPLAAILLLVSTGTFAAQSLPSFELLRDTSSGSNAETIAQGDFNGDGKPDIIMGGAAGGGQSASEIRLRLGNGDGTFQPSKVVSTAGGAITELTVADVNGDGKLDLVVVVPGANFEVFYGNGDGSFQAPLKFSTTYPAVSVAVGDFNGDGLLDVAVGDTNRSVEIFNNVGGKNFVLASTVNQIGTLNDGIVKVRAGNVDGNGNLDLAVLSLQSAFVLWGNGHSHFSAVQLLGLQGSSYVNPADLNVADLNQDGMDDIMISYYCGAAIATVPTQYSFAPCVGVDVFYGQGNETTFYRHVVTDPTVDAATIWAADVNGDGIADIVSSSRDDSETKGGLFVWLGHPNGSFDQTAQRFIANPGGSTPVGTFSILSTIVSSGGPPALVPGDWNRDGMIDFADAAGEIYINSGERGPCAVSEINPTVTVCAPVNDTYATSPVRMQANAYDSTPVTALQEYVDGRLMYSNGASSFNLSLEEAPGVHFLVAKAWDARGVSFRSDRTITVYSGVPGATCAAALGTAELCLPDGPSVSPVHILGNGSTAEVPTAAQLYVDGRLVVNETGCGSGFCGGTSYVDTYEAMSRGTHDVVFKLWDSAGKTYVAQKWVAVE